jgi:2,3-bisphosphoglycerate-dependent phosphoglycerate mutase
MVKKYGEEQVNLWRRSYDIAPPKVKEDDPRHPKNDPKYKDVDPSLLPSGESLKDTYNRVVPYFQKEIETKLKIGKNIILSSHHNALRAMVKYLDQISDEAIVKVNIPYCIPLVYEWEKGQKVNKYYLGTDKEVEEIIQLIKNQTKS